MATYKVGVQLRPQHMPFEEYRRVWTRLDDMGVDSLWTWDHFFPLYGDLDGLHLEGWTSLAFLAAETKRATVGNLVLSMSYRNPALLSAMAATLDQATGGRLVLGLGAGWFKRDYDEYGFEFGTAGERLRNLERGLRIIRERWQKDALKPVRGAVPILIGAGGEKVGLRIAAEHADLWHGFGGPVDWAHKNRVLDEWCAKVGRDPAQIERTASVDEGHIARLDDYASRGATHFIVGLGIANAGAAVDLSPVERMLAWRDRH